MNWGWGGFVAGSLALVIFLCLNAYLAARLLQRGELNYNPLLHPLENVGRVVFIGLCLLLGWLSGLSFERLAWTDPAPLANAAIGLLAAGVLQELNHQGTRWIVRARGRDAYSPGMLQAMLPHSGREWGLSVAALLPAAFGEELLFRSLLLGGFSVFANPWALAAVFAFLFGLVHLPQGRWGIVGASLLGFALSALFIWRWSLVACTLAHYGINLAQLVRAEGELRWLQSEEP